MSANCSSPLESTAALQLLLVATASAAIGAFGALYLIRGWIRELSLDAAESFAVGLMRRPGLRDDTAAFMAGLMGDARMRTVFKDVMLETMRDLGTAQAMVAASGKPGIYASV